ncbi:MAG: hypothetical protein ACKPCM_12350, partial [Pseudanabaena sp.]
KKEKLIQKLNFTIHRICQIPKNRTIDNILLNIWLRLRADNSSCGIADELPNQLLMDKLKLFQNSLGSDRSEGMLDIDHLQKIG